MQLNLQREIEKVEYSIAELENWKRNRQRRAQQRAMENNHKPPMSSAPLERAIDSLKQYREVLRFYIKKYGKN